jgi:ATP-dependent Clp protease protease subunit
MTEITTNDNLGIRVNYELDDALFDTDLKITPKVIWVNEFDDSSAKQFATDMHQAHRTGQPIIPVVIDSYGGEVYSLLSMIAEIGASELPVATIVKGKAMSCGSFLAACGTPGHRYCDPEATYMVHEVSSMAWGKVEEVKADAAETNRLNKRLFRILAEKCGQSPTYFLNLVHEKNHADWYLSASQARKHNLVDHIRIPKMDINVCVKWSLS